MCNKTKNLTVLLKKYNLTLGFVQGTTKILKKKIVFNKNRFNIKQLSSDSILCHTSEPPLLISFNKSIIKGLCTTSHLHLKK